MRVVVTTPVAMPASRASSSTLSRLRSASRPQSRRGSDWSTLTTPARVFTPVAMAVMVPAESGVCMSVL